uniref:acyl carrier protein n=1 Tax=Aliarcobacter sp. TaxID=2321116 RepID=UPI004048E8A8
MENDVKQLIASYFKVNIEKITDETTAFDIDGWDSLSHTELLLEIEQKFNISFELSDLMEMDNVGKLIEIIKCK